MVDSLSMAVGASLDIPEKRDHLIRDKDAVWPMGYRERSWIESMQDEVDKWLSSVKL